MTLPAYRGDAVNGFDFTAAARRPDPQRLLGVYNASAATLNLTRAFVTGGFAHLRSVHSWNADFVKNSAAGVQYQNLAERDRPGAGVHGGLRDRRRRVRHRRLLLQPRGADPGVRARADPDRLADPTPYGTSGHFLWIGERTRQLDGAHVELLRHVRNPLGVKLGPTTTADTALELADRLDPDHEPGRITFITRMGAGKVRDVLPEVVAKVTASGRQVAWVCDPMHGNTFEARNGYKTRAFSDVMEELNGFFDVHEELGTWPGGVHVELTGDDVTECVGGSDDLVEADLVNRYETLCDPRLNRNQSLELAFLVAERLTTGRINAGEPGPVVPAALHVIARARGAPRPARVVVRSDDEKRVALLAPPSREGAADDARRSVVHVICSRTRRPTSRSSRRSSVFDRRRSQQILCFCQRRFSSCATVVRSRSRQ